ncbi:hypothetical protein GFK26_12525 [Variovorax paradoxus]|uniref:Uncharacterized protein n=1 Tax=Variovorax paradoxus TaxID=34073 RepID=A0A5Q0M4Y2_VARPD|nr:hypothetical protein [Variovorax paradoxus]QFZ83525.1 hypothetical protein GFK26_12525 [Variovorax paradoxus]
MKFLAVLAVCLISAPALARDGFLCTPMRVEPYRFNKAGNCPGVDKNLNIDRCSQFSVAKDAAQITPDRYYWIFQSDQVAKEEMTLNRHTGSYAMEIAYVVDPKWPVAGIGF